MFQRIIGEVEFYKVTNQRIEQRQREEEEKKEGEEPRSPTATLNIANTNSLASDSKKLIGADDASSRPQSALSSDVKELQGEFYGTDFNFLYSEEMQRALATNCLSANWDSLMNFTQHQ